MKHKGVLYILALAVALTIGCHANVSRWTFVHAEPRPEDAVGTYVLTDQTIMDGGLSALNGRQCKMTIRADGYFSVTNYPDRREAISSSGPYFKNFLSITGRWTIGSPGSSRGKTCWGMLFMDEENKIAPVAFTGQAPPYGLISILGDPDSNIVMIFKKE